MRDIMFSYIRIRQLNNIIKMDIRNEKNYVFNIKLAKCICLYQMLDPGTVKFRGQNVYHIVMVCILVYMFTFSMILNLSGLYYWTVNIPISIDYFWKSETTLYVIYKIWIVVRHSNDIWNCLSITRYGFTSSSNRNRHYIILDRWRERSVSLTLIYAILYSMSMITYMLITLVFSEGVSPVKNHDGSIGYYRQNIMNFYLIVSEETYNAHFYMFYFAEALYLIFLIISFLIFDILLVTLCFGMCCQLELICCAAESVGHKSLNDSNSPIDYTDENNKIPNEHDIIYDELKKIIMDHQAVMETYEKFITLFRRVMLLQILISSLSVISLCFIFIMSFSNDDRFQASEVVIKKLFCSIPSLLFQIFMVCYLFGNLHNQKDSIIFALYSSNWTEVDMKCKKLILLTMKLNNAYYKKLKFTRTKIVNLEMFFKTMGDCYSIISVLVNYIQRKVE